MPYQGLPTDIKMRKIASYPGLIILAFFIIYSYFVSLNIFRGVDWLATKYLQEVIPRFVDIPFSIFSLFGSAEIVLLLLLILCFIYKKLNIIYVLFGYVVFHVIELASKFFLHHLGPPHELVRYFFDFSFPSSGVKPGNSYPSGHVGRTIFFSTVILFLIWDSKKLTIRKKQLLCAVVIIFDILMSISRIYLGEHWLSDVLGGALLGLAVALFVFNAPNFLAKK